MSLSPHWQRGGAAHRCTPRRGYAQATVGPVNAGQPTPEAHPHLMGANELTPGIPKSEYAERRQRLADKMPPSSAAVIPGYTTRYATHNIFYPFQQSTDLFYLTGFDEPDAVAIIEKSASGEVSYSLFVRPADAHSKLWEGPRAGLKGATSIFGADRAESSLEFGFRLDSMARRVKHVYLDKPKDMTLFHADRLVQYRTGTAGVGTGTFMSRLRFGSEPTTEKTEGKVGMMHDLSPILQKMRWLKSPAELTAMHKAGQISGDAFIEVMRYTRPGVGEAELSARMEWECRKQGARGLAYVPVVAGGHNALTMHYVQNQQLLRDGDLVLMDAGSHYQGYCSDVTRTWPVNGKFSPAQRDLYEAVLAVQKHCIDLCKQEGGVTLDQIHHESIRQTVEELANVGWKASRSDVERKLYPHHIGHYLGLDVHDTPTVGRSVPLLAGSVVTIEPGIYVPDEAHYPKAFRGIGIRIEDDVVVGAEHPLILSAWAPKEVVDLEALCGKGLPE